MRATGTCHDVDQIRRRTCLNREQGWFSLPARRYVTDHRTVEKGGVTIQEAMRRGVGKIKNGPRTASLLVIQWIATEASELLAWCHAIDCRGIIFTAEETTAGRTRLCSSKTTCFHVEEID